MAQAARPLTQPAVPLGGYSAMVALAGTAPRLMLPEVAVALPASWATVGPAGPVAPAQLVALVVQAAC